MYLSCIIYCIIILFYTAKDTREDVVYLALLFPLPGVVYLLYLDFVRSALYITCLFVMLSLIFCVDEYTKPVAT